jgi:MoaE-MoaD fusion protein
MRVQIRLFARCGSARASGACRESRVHVRRDAISRGGRARVDPPLSGGAVVTFQGVTREVPALEYEAYVEMARAKIAEIAAAVATRHGLYAVAIEHRIGNVPLSEASVVIAVSAPHRGEAFAGASEIIDALKETAPIWKREEGEWAHGHSPQ